MPFSTRTEARDAIVGHFEAFWTANSGGVLLKHDDRAKPDIPTDGSSWARIQVRHVAGAHAAFGSGGVTVSGRFRHSGIITVQIFTKFGEGLAAADTLANVAVDAFEGKATAPDAAEFRNVRVNEVGQDGEWFQTNVLSDFEWDIVK